MLDLLNFGFIDNLYYLKIDFGGSIKELATKLTTTKGNLKNLKDNFKKAINTTFKEYTIPQMNNVLTQRVEGVRKPFFKLVHPLKTYLFCLFNRYSK